MLFLWGVLQQPGTCGRNDRRQPDAIAEDKGQKPEPQSKEYTSVEAEFSPSPCVNGGNQVAVVVTTVLALLSLDGVVAAMAEHSRIIVIRRRITD